MSSWAAWKNLDTDRLLQKSSSPISTPTAPDLSAAALHVMSTDYGYITRLLGALCQIYRGVGGGAVKTGADGRGRDRDTGTEPLSVAGKRVFYEGARGGDDLGLKRNVEFFYPSLRFLPAWSGHAHVHGGDGGAAPVENSPLGKILDETKWLRTPSASVSESNLPLHSPDTSLKLTPHQIEWSVQSDGIPR